MEASPIFDKPLYPLYHWRLVGLVICVGPPCPFPTAHAGCYIPALSTRYRNELYPYLGIVERARVGDGVVVIGGEVGRGGGKV